MALTWLHNSTIIVNSVLKLTNVTFVSNVEYTIQEQVIQLSMYLALEWVFIAFYNIYIFKVKSTKKILVANFRIKTNVEFYQML